jgi:GNAT superfamily N-acetyltransferase
MQRMFVYPSFQGQGIGRALANRLISEVRASGYDYIWLDTAPPSIGCTQSLSQPRIRTHCPIFRDTDRPARRAQEGRLVYGATPLARNPFYGE